MHGRNRAGLRGQHWPRACEPRLCPQLQTTDSKGWQGAPAGGRGPVLHPRRRASVCPRLPAGCCVEGPPVHRREGWAGLSLGGHRRSPSRSAVGVCLGFCRWRASSLILPSGVRSPCFPRMSRGNFEHSSSRREPSSPWPGHAPCVQRPRWHLQAVGCLAVLSGARRAPARHCVVSCPAAPLDGAWPSGYTSPLAWCLQCVVPAYSVPSGQLSSAPLRPGVAFHVGGRQVCAKLARCGRTS